MVQRRQSSDGNDISFETPQGVERMRPPVLLNAVHILTNVMMSIIITMLITILIFSI